VGVAACGAGQQGTISEGVLTGRTVKGEEGRATRYAKHCKVWYTSALSAAHEEHCVSKVLKGGAAGTSTRMAPTPRPCVLCHLVAATASVPPPAAGISSAATAGIADGTAKACLIALLPHKQDLTNRGRQPQVPHSQLGTLPGGSCTPCAAPAMTCNTRAASSTL
jgi:hypothetical protein